MKNWSTLGDLWKKEAHYIQLACISPVRNINIRNTKLFKSFQCGNRSIFWNLWKKEIQFDTSHVYLRCEITYWKHHWHTCWSCEWWHWPACMSTVWFSFPCLVQQMHALLRCNLRMELSRNNEACAHCL